MEPPTPAVQGASGNTCACTLLKAVNPKFAEARMAPVKTIAPKIPKQLPSCGFLP